MRTLFLLAMIVTAQTIPLHQSIVFETTKQSSPDIAGPITGEIIRETPHFQIYAEQSFAPVNLDWFAEEAEATYDYLVQRLEVRPTERFAVVFRPPDTAACPVRGLARFETPVARAIVSADAQTPRNQVSGVFAHELAHLFRIRGMKVEAPDMNLDEGFATWSAGKYWDAWQGPWEDRVRSFLREGRYIPLEKYFGPDVTDDRTNCLRGRDLRYTSWAGFIDFLIHDYGMEKFRKLLSSMSTSQEQGLGIMFRFPFPIDQANVVGPRVPSSFMMPFPDFKGVYGLSLAELEKLWLKKLN